MTHTSHPAELHRDGLSEASSLALTSTTESLSSASHILPQIGSRELKWGQSIIMSLKTGTLTQF